jgi:hypothetical protein
LLGRLKAWLPWIIATIFLAAAVVFGVMWFQLRQDQTKGDQVRSTASQFVDALTNFSADTIDTDTAEIRSYAVGDFKKEADTFFGPKAVAAIKKAKAVSKGDIDSLFIQSLDGDEATVFGVVTQTITNAFSSAPRTDALKLEVGMINTTDGWKVNRVDVFQQPGSGILGAGGTGTGG